MRKIFFYEFRRLVFTKFYAGILAVCLGFGWQVLTTKTILGVSNTAPFSPWSFGSYLAEVMPVLCVAMIFFLLEFFSEKGRRVQVLTAATPAPRAFYLLVKCAAAASAWLLMALCVVMLGIGFLLALFGDAVFVGLLLLSALTVLLPTLVFVLGLGLLSGRAHPALLIALVLVLAAVYLLPLPAAFDLFSANFFSNYPLTLEVIDPTFSIPFSVFISKLIYTILGASMISLAIRQEATNI